MNEQIIQEETLSSTSDWYEYIPAVRKAGARRFSFTEAILGSLGETSEEMPLHINTSPGPTSNHSQDGSLERWNKSNNNVGSSQILPTVYQDRSPRFEYSKREQPQSQIGRKIDQFEYPNERPSSETACKRKQVFRESHTAKFRKGSLEDEMQRPEVLALVKKYHPGGDVTLGTGTHSVEYRIPEPKDSASLKDVDVETQRKHYRQKVASHYKRIVEEQSTSPDPEFLSQSWSSDVSFREADSPVYKPGIDDSDWQEIDHRRSLSLEKDKSFEKPGPPDYRSDSDGEHTVAKPDDRPGCLSKGRSPNKKQKKVRVRRHDSLIMSDSEPSPSNRQADSLDLAIDEMVDENKHCSDDQDDIDYGSDMEQYALEDPDIFSSFDDHFTTVEGGEWNSWELQDDSYKTLPRREQEAQQPDGPESLREYQSVERPLSAPTLESFRPSHSSSLEEYYLNLGRAQSGYVPSESSERSSRLDPQTYQSYAAGILNSSSKSEPFLKLQKQYATLERIAQIEEDTQCMNSMLGRSRFNNLDVRSKSLGSLAPQSNADAMLLSKYKLDNLWELRELYAELDEAQEAEEFFFDTKNLEEVQWNPWADRGLNCKNLTIQDLQLLYEAGKNLNTKSKRGRPLKENPDFKRELSFKKLCEKYQHLDEECRKGKIMEEVIRMRLRGRRDSDTSSVVSQSSNMMGSYLQIQENTRQKARERPLYGYYIKEEPNRYESYVQKLTNLSKSCPDISKETQNKTTKSFGEKPPVVPNRKNPSEERKSRRKPEKPLQWKQTTERTSPSIKSSESGYDSLDSRNGAHPRRDFRGRARNDSKDSVDGGRHPRPSRSGGSPERSTSRATTIREKNRSNPVWKTEIRGVVGVQQASAATARPPVQKAQAWNREIREVVGHRPSPHENERKPSTIDDTRRGRSQEHKNVETRDRACSRPDDADGQSRNGIYGRGMPNKEPSDVDRARARTAEPPPRKHLENFRLRNRSRKDSKPNPGAVSSALSIFRSLEEDYWKGQWSTRPGRRMNGNSYKMSTSMENVKRAQEYEEDDVFQVISETKKKSLPWETRPVAPVKFNIKDASGNHSRPSAEARKGAFRKYGHDREVQKRKDHASESMQTPPAEEQGKLVASQRQSIGASSRYKPQIRSRSESPRQRSTKDGDTHRDTASLRSQQPVQKKQCTDQAGSAPSQSELAGSQYEYVSVTTSKAAPSYKTEFTVKYNPATGRMTPVEELKTGTRSLVSLGPTYVKSNQAEVRQLAEPHLSEDQKYERKWGVHIPPSTGESGAVNVTYYQKKQDHRRSPPSPRKTHDTKVRDSLSSAHKTTDASAPQRDNLMQMHGASRSSEMLSARQEAPTVNMGHSSPTARVPPMRPGGNDSAGYDSHNLPTRARRALFGSDETRPQSAAGSTAKDTHLLQQHSPLENEHHRSYSASQMDRDETVTDPNYGDLERWSGVNVNEDLNRRHGEQDAPGKLQKWGATNLTRADSKETGSNDTLIIYSSNDTMIIKGSDPDLSRSFESPRTYSSVKRMKHMYETRKLERSYSDSNLSEGQGADDASTYPSAAKSEANLADEEKATSPYFRQQHKAKQRGEMPRTVSGNLKDIRQKYESGSAFRDRAWEKYEPETPTGTMGQAWRRNGEIPLGEMRKISPIVGHWQRLIGDEARPAEAATTTETQCRWDLVRGEVSGKHSRHGKLPAPVSHANTGSGQAPHRKDLGSNHKPGAQSPSGFRAWDVVRSETSEVGPQQMIENIDIIGSEWQRDSLKRGASLATCSDANRRVASHKEQPQQHHQPGYQVNVAPPQETQQGKENPRSVLLYDRNRQTPSTQYREQGHQASQVHGQGQQQTASRWEYVSSSEQHQTPPGGADEPCSLYTAPTGTGLRAGGRQTGPAPYSTGRIPSKSRPLSCPVHSTHQEQHLPPNAYYHPVSHKGAAAISHNQPVLDRQHHQGAASSSHPDKYQTIPRGQQEGAASCPDMKSWSSSQPEFNRMNDADVPGY